MKAFLNRDFSDKSYGVSVHPEHDISGLYYFVYSVGYEEIGSKYYLKRSEFFCHMLTYIVKGSGHLIYNGKEYDFKGNDLIFMNCMKEHIMYPNDEGMTIYFIHFSHPGLESFSNYVLSQEGPIINNIDKKMSDNIINIVESSKNNNINDDVFSKIIYETLLSIRTLKSFNNTTLLYAPKTIQIATRYIEEHYHEKLSLEQLSGIVGVSKFHFEKIFKKYVKQTFYDYLSFVRFKKSQQILLTTNDSLDDVAFKVGLSDSQSLIRLYKKFLSTTPLQYKKARI